MEDPLQPRARTWAAVGALLLLAASMSAVPRDGWLPVPLDLPQRPRPQIASLPTHPSWRDLLRPPEGRLDPALPLAERGPFFAIQTGSMPWLGKGIGHAHWEIFECLSLAAFYAPVREFIPGRPLFVVPPLVSCGHGVGTRCGDVYGLHDVLVGTEVNVTHQSVEVAVKAGLLRSVDLPGPFHNATLFRAALEELAAKHAGQDNGRSLVCHFDSPDRLHIAVHALEHVLRWAFAIPQDVGREKDLASADVVRRAQVVVFTDGALKDVGGIDAGFPAGLVRIFASDHPPRPTNLSAAELFLWNRTADAPSVLHNLASADILYRQARTIPPTVHPSPGGEREPGGRRLEHGTSERMHLAQ
ncbi:hypothetical protein DFJ74DRAFT_763559 [Hyaloraphidium curvatum]|nr:hypothetical protein DFJ74DRAFT_763559 [Hyaloraphidium curvatum]